MSKPEQFINVSNAITTIRYLLNLDINVIDEKYRKIGISCLFDLVQTKRLCVAINHSDTAMRENAKQLTEQAISLARILSDEAQQNLVGYLALHQGI